MTGATGGEQVFESLVHLYSAEPLENEIGWDDMKQGHEEQGCIRGKKAMRHTCNIYIYIYYIWTWRLRVPQFPTIRICQWVSGASGGKRAKVRAYVCQNINIFAASDSCTCPPSTSDSKTGSEQWFFKIFLKAYGHRLSDSVTALTV